jgi:hypothetical protein
MEDRKKVIEGFANEAETIAGSSLRSLFIYGSAVAGGFVEKKSDYNFVLVADPIEISLLDRLSTRASHWRKQRIPVPLIVTPQFMERARDTYPLELLSMISGYELLRGEDLLQGVSVSSIDVRHQCERELRAMTLHLRQAYVELGRSFPELRSLLGRAQPGVLAIFRGLLFVTEGLWHCHGEAFRAALTERLGTSAKLVSLLSRVRHDVTVSSGETTELIRDLIPEMERWTGRIDQH